MEKTEAQDKIDRLETRLDYANAGQFAIAYDMLALCKTIEDAVRTIKRSPSS